MPEPPAAAAMRRYATQLPRLRRAFARSVLALNAEAASRGIGRSGAFIHLTQELCIEETARRIEAAKHAVKELLDSGAWPASSEEALRAFDDCLATDSGGESSFGDIVAALRQAIAIVGPLGSALDGVAAEVDCVRGDLIAEAHAELVSTTMASQARRGAPTVFEGSIGSVQIGSHNTTMHAKAEHGEGGEREPHIIAEDAAEQLAREQRGRARD